MSTAPNVIWDEPAHNVKWDADSYSEAGAAQNPPTASFATPKGINPYLGAAQAAGSTIQDANDKVRSTIAASPTFQAVDRAMQPITKPLSKVLSNPNTQIALSGVGGGTVANDAEGLVNDASEALAPKTQQALLPADKPTLLQHVVQQLTGTTPERIAELGQVEDKVADAHQVAIQAEAKAKAAASAAFPDIQTPVRLSPGSVGAPEPPPGGFDPEAVLPTTVPPTEIPFKEAQQQYSQLAMDARAVHKARVLGMATGFDEQAILQQKNALGAAMQDAADADGKLDQFNAAKKGFAQFMNDFHNRGSAVEPLLEMQPDETSKIVSHFLNPDKGARAIETLQNYGADVSPIQDLLSKGATPLKIDVNEAAKLRKVGEAGYGPLRLQESIDQATYNRLPASAQARLPAAAMKQSTKIPYLPDAISPSIPTRYLTKKLLLSDLAKTAVTKGNP